MKRVLLVIMTSIMLAATGCTIRFSKAVDNVAPGARGTRVSAESTGLQVFQIEVNDTEPAENLIRRISSGCRELRNVVVDYRTMFILFVDIPKLTVSADCVK